MKYKVTQEFRGEIEGVVFTDQRLFDTTVYVMETLELEAGKEFVNSELVDVFSEELWKLYLNSDSFEVEDIEKEISPTSTDYPIGGSAYGMSFAGTNSIIRVQMRLRSYFLK